MQKKSYLSYLQLYLFFALSIVLSGCNPQSEADMLLQQAQKIMEQNPDSAMKLIDSIFYPEKSLDKSEYMTYLVTKVQAKYKTYQPVAEDTLIFEARDYFAKHKKEEKKMVFAHFYSGCVYREQKSYKNAMQAYKDAARMAERMNDMERKALIQYNIADILEEQGLYKEALDNYKLAERLFAKSSEKHHEKQSRCFSAIGQMYVLLNEKDSAFLYFKRGIKFAEDAGDNQLQSLLSQNLSVTYLEAKQYEESKKYIEKAYKLNQSSLEAPRYYLTFAKLYREQKKEDSTFFYTSLLKESVDSLKDKYLQIGIYSYLTEREQEMRRFKEAFFFQNQKINVLVDIMETRRQQTILEVQKKFDFEHLKNKYNRMLIAKQQKLIFILFFLLGVSVIAIVLFRSVLAQKNKLLKMQENLQILRETARHLQALQSGQEQNEERLRETLLWKFNVLQKVSLLKLEGNNERADERKLIKKFEEVVYGKNNESQWQSLLQSIEDMNPGVSEIIRTSYPELTENEFRICLLSYAGLRAKETALILNLSTNTVNMLRSNIRKKMQLQAYEGDFYTSLRELYQKRKQ